MGEGARSGWRRRLGAAVPALRALGPFGAAAGATLLEAAAYALVLRRAPAPSVLPLLYVACALLAGPAAAFSRTGAPSRRAAALETGVWIALFAGLRALIAHATGAAAALPALALFVATAVCAARLLARRPRPGAPRSGFGALAGLAAGGTLTVLAGPALGAPGLVVAGCAALALALAADLAPDAPTPAAAASTPGGARRAPTPHDASLSRRILALAVVLATLGAVADYAFRRQAAQLRGEGAMLVLFGAVAAAAGLLALLARRGPAEAALRRAGLFWRLALAPLAALAGAAGTTALGGAWPAALLKGAERVGALETGRAALEAAAAPLSDRVRARLRGRLAHLVVPAGWALGGALLLVPGAAAGAPLAAAALCALALGALALVHARYVQVLGDRLNSEAAEEPGPGDAAGRKVLERALADPDERRVRAALALLSRDAEARLEPHLPGLLAHPSAKVRAQAARLAGEREAGGCAERLVELALGDEGEAREAALLSVARLRPYTAARLLEPLLSRPELEVRAAAVAALFPLDPTGPAGRALEAILAEGERAPAAGRAQVARLLGRLGPGARSRRLREFLRDPDATVRRAACEAAGESRDAALADDLVGQLAAREARAEARGALVRLGDAVADRLEALLTDAGQPPVVRHQLPRILRDLGTPRALQILLFTEPEDDALLAHRLCHAAGALHARHPETPVDRERTLEAAGRRLDAYEALRPAARDLRAALGEGHLLVRAVEERLDQQLEEAVRLAALLVARRPLLNAFNRFVHGDEATRPLALEMVARALEPPLERRVVSLLEGWHRGPERAAGRRERAPGRLLELLAGRDATLRGLAAATAREAAAQRRAGGASRGPAWDVLVRAPPAQEGGVNEAVIEKILILQGVDIFADSAVDDLAALAQQVRERSLRAGEIIYRENDPGDALYVVVEGGVVLEKDGQPAVELAAGQSFGETSLLDHRPRSATARARADTRLLVLERADFLDLVSDRVELLQGIFTAVTRHLRSLLDASLAGRITSPSLTPVAVSRVGARRA